MSEPSPYTAWDVFNRHGLTMDVRRVTPSKASQIQNRCTHCAALLRVRKGLHPKVHLAPFGNAYRCAACDAVINEPLPQSIEYRVTFRSASGASLETSYTRGSAWQFKGDELNPGYVLDALRNDASSWIYCADVDDFLREFCDVANAEDPIKAVREGESAYRACGDTYKRLGLLLGVIGRNELMNAEGM